MESDTTVSVEIISADVEQLGVMLYCERLEKTRARAPKIRKTVSEKGFYVFAFAPAAKNK